MDITHQLLANHVCVAAGAVTGAVALPGVHNAVSPTAHVAIAIAITAVTSPASAPASATVAVNLIVARSSRCPLRSDTGYATAFTPCESLADQTTNQLPINT